MKNIKLDDTRLKVQIVMFLLMAVGYGWPRQVQDHNIQLLQVLTSIMSRGAHGILIVYDITDRESFQSLKYWLSEVEKYQ